MNHRPLIIAHRGVSYTEKENTLAAYQKAIKIGVDGIEMDLRMTADGVIVCHHDRGVTPLRPSGFAGRGRYWIDKIKWEELKKISNGEIERFEEVVKKLMWDVRSAKWDIDSLNSRTLEVRKEEIPFQKNQDIKNSTSKTSHLSHHTSNILLDLDLKQEGMEREIVRILKKYKIKKVLVNSTDIWTLKAFEDVWPAAELVLSYHPKDPRDLINHKTVRFLTLLTYYSLKPLLFRLIRRKTAIGDIHWGSLNYRLVNTKVVQFLHQYNIKVFVWGTEDVKKLRCLVTLGVDGVKTRRPDLLRKIIGRI